MVQSVASLRLHEVVLQEVKSIEIVHEVVNWRLGLVEYLLTQRIEVLSVVNDHFAVLSREQPLVVWLQVRVLEAVKARMD